MGDAVKLVSVIIPVGPYHKDIVRDAVESVRQQTVDCDVIVIQDSEGKGAGWARNKGLQRVRTPFVVFLDADDFLAPMFVERCLAAWRPNSYVWTHWYEGGQICPIPGVTPHTHTVTCLLATDLALAHGGFDKTLEAAEDTDFYVKLLTAGVKAVRVAEPLLWYNVSLGQRQAGLIASGQFETLIRSIHQRYAPDPLSDTFNFDVVPDWTEIADTAMTAQRVTAFKRKPTWQAPGPVAEVTPTWRPGQQPAPTHRGDKAPRRDACDISVIVPTHNRLGYLQNMIASARHAMPSMATYEFVVVDGGSTDGTLDWCRAEPDVWLVEHGALLGTVKAFTDGAKDARGLYVLQCNDDSEFIDDAIARAAAWLDHHPRCGCVAFAYDHPRHPGQFVVGQHEFTRPDGQVLKLNFANEGMYRKVLGDAMGWFGADDPDFGARSYGSDSYASVRVWEMGYTIDAVPGACLHDRDARDHLKVANQYPPDMANPDTKAFYKRFPHGPDIPLEPRVEVTR